MALSAADKIAALKEKKDRLEAKLRSEIVKAKAKDRKLAARRQTVVGTAILAAIEGDDGLAKIIAAALATHVTAPADRAIVSDLIKRVDKAAAASDTKAA